MSPVALHPHDNGLSRNANGKNTSTATATVTVATPAETRVQQKATPSVHLSSADVIRLEHEFGAHKYEILLFTDVLCH
jgi:PKD repeat protein